MKIKEILEMLENCDNEVELKEKINVLGCLDQIAVIRKYLKQEDKGFKIRNDRGTAYGWCVISGSEDDFGHFTDKQTQILEDFGLNGMSNCELISPDSLDYWCLKCFNHLN